MTSPEVKRATLAISPVLPGGPANVKSLSAVSDGEQGKPVYDLAVHAAGGTLL